MRAWPSTIVAVIVATAFVAGDLRAEDDPVQAAPRNPAVLAAARLFPEAGGYRNNWATGTGSPVEIAHGGVQILKKDDVGTYCSGMTFATAMKVLREAGLIEGKSTREIRAFQKTWYGTTSATAEKQCAQALVQLGVGKEVSADEARPGDFAQFWRSNGSGHSVVFLGWVEKGGRRVGIRYRSSQPATKGIGDASERFEGHGGKVMPTRIYFGRIE